MPEYEEYKSEKKSDRRASVYSFAGEDKGKFDETHIVGSEVVRGIPPEDAKDRARRVRNIVELVGEEKVSTDSIRFMLDGLRNIEKGDRLRDDDLRGFRDHIRIESNRLKTLDKKEEVDYRLGKVKLAPVGEGEPGISPIVLAGWRHKGLEFRERDCRWALRRRTSRHFIEILSIDFDESEENLFSYRITYTQTTRLVEELKRIIRHNLSSSITLESLGITSTAGLDSESVHREITERVTNLHYVLVVTHIILKVTLRMRRRIDYEESWGWVGNDCPMRTYVPERRSYSLYGAVRSYEFVHEADYFLLRQDQAHSDAVSEDYWWNRTKDDFMDRLRRSFGRPTEPGGPPRVPPWMPELPWPPNAPPTTTATSSSSLPSTTSGSSSSGGSGGNTSTGDDSTTVTGTSDDKENCFLQSRLTVDVSRYMDPAKRVSIDYRIDSGGDTLVRRRNQRAVISNPPNPVRRRFDKVSLTVPEGCNNGFNLSYKFSLKIEDENNSSIDTAEHTMDIYIPHCQGSTEQDETVTMNYADVKLTLTINNMSCI